jgi:hypothetical protein
MKSNENVATKLRAVEIPSTPERGGAIARRAAEARAQVNHGFREVAEIMREAGDTEAEDLINRWAGNLLITLATIDEELEHIQGQGQWIEEHSQ